MTEIEKFATPLVAYLPAKSKGEKMKEIDEIEYEEDELVCPNCGRTTGGETTCPYCGAILTNEDEELDEVGEEEEY